MAFTSWRFDSDYGSISLFAQRLTVGLDVHIGPLNHSPYRQCALLRFRALLRTLERDFDVSSYWGWTSTYDLL